MSDRLRETAIVGAMMFVLCVAYAFIFLPYLPNANGTIGTDYSIYFPSLLAGYYWFVQNGPFAIPWFSPAECGGFPYFADPNAAYFSAPQFLTFVWGPLAAARIVLILFALLGFLGCYLMMRRSFRVSAAAALMAAALFMFNGYFVYRMLAGHLTFHAFMLTPWVAFVLLPPGDERPSGRAIVLRIGGAGAAVGYMYQAGMIHGILPALLALAMLLLIHAILFGWRAFPWWAAAGAGLLAAALSAGKFAAGLALAHQFPRTQYVLPGVPDPLVLAGLALRTLFLSPPDDAASLLVNRLFAMQRHEWEYGVSPVAGLLIAAGIAVAIAGLVRRRALPRWSWPKAAALAALVVLAFVPLLLNWYSPGWNGFLKSLPFFGNSNQLVRWFSAYIPIAVVLAGLALDRLPAPPEWRPVLTTLGLVVLLGWNIFADRSYYAAQLYVPAAIEGGYEQAASTGTVPPIHAIGAVLDTAGRLQMTVDRNDLLVKGVSELACYQPILGYGLEAFPLKSLHSGQAMRPAGGMFNVKNPACYLFPAENRCEPGDQFPEGARDDAVHFLAYEPFPFAMPAWQAAANWLSLTAFVGLVAAGLGAVVLPRPRRQPALAR